MKSFYPATLLCDFYKVSHRIQYPKNTHHVYSTMIARGNKYYPEADEGSVSAGMQPFIIQYLVEYFNENFFNRKKEEVLEEYQFYIYYSIKNPGNIAGLSEEEQKQGMKSVDVNHLAELWELGYLPIEIKGIAEGTLIPLRVPMMTIENTDKRFFWLTNYLETLLSNEVWLSVTSATTSRLYRKILNEYALETTGSTAGVEFQGHDFSMRGMQSKESAAASGAAHLFSFVGSDTIPAIMYLEKFYNANVRKEVVATSIDASEHSVMCAHGNENEFDLFKEFITEKYPSGFVSVVSDTWDFWKVVTEYLPALKEQIMARDGRLVIRPDSGDPVKIIIGDPEGKTEAERKGLIECLWDIFSGIVNELGYKVLDPHIGAIYGDSITLERARLISEGLKQKGFASTNIVYGIGSFTYSYKSRDNLAQAIKATYVDVEGEERLIQKDPKTDDGTKKSLRGRVVVVERDGKLQAIDQLTRAEAEAYAHEDKLQVLFRDGKIYNFQTLAEVRARVAATI